MEPLVSILIPAYNAQSTIAETINSALAQTWCRKEIIVVDDGSKDSTLSIASGFASSGVIVLKKSNMGAAASRNTAFSACSGDYIQWLDADDLLAPDKISRQMTLVQEGLGNQTVLCGAWGQFYYRLRKAEFTPTDLWSDLAPVEWLIHKFNGGAFMQTAAWLVSRELTEAAGPWDTRLLSDDDGEYFCRVVLKSNGTRFVPESRSYYRVPGSKTLSYIGSSGKKMEAHFLSMKLHINHLRAVENSDRVRAASVNYLQHWLGFFYPERPDVVSEAENLARELGGRLHPPGFTWKYAWIKTLFGWSAAKHFQLRYNNWKNSGLRALDKALLPLERAHFQREHDSRHLTTKTSEPQIP